MEIASIDLGFAEEDEVRAEMVSEVFEIINISSKTLDVPGEYRKG